MDFLSKFFFNSRSRDEENEMNYIVKGYPLTTSPVIPDILKHQVRYETMNDKYGNARLALTLAHEGTDLVEPESLEVIRNKMLKWFNKYPELSEYFKKPLPTNLIALSFNHANFRMGEESCHDFKLCNGYKEAENSFYTYRKLSESLQCVYYNENGIEYLAGGCFYPAPRGKPTFPESNDALVHFVQATALAYPLGDRMKSYSFVTYKIYGRFCATAGKNVLVDCGLTDGVPSHFEYNHSTKKYGYILCDECCRDYYTYNWKDPKKDTPAAPVAVPEPASVMSIPAAATTTDAESSPVTRASSTESLMGGFERIDVSSNVESDIDDAEYID
ncbi:unnamed protein product [Caenorhabditis brenneri]